MFGKTSIINDLINDLIKSKTKEELVCEDICRKINLELEKAFAQTRDELCG